MTASADAPYPPLDLASRVCSLDDRGEPFAAYEQLGAEAKAALIELLPADWTFAGKSVLDFGCGAGRTLRHFLGEALEAEFWGADIDGPSISWLNQNLNPPLHAIQNGPDPPLALDHEGFDLACALSVFTHLTDNSLPWLAELHHVLKPGGLLVATYMGRLNGEWLTHEPWDEDRIGMNVLRPDQGWEHGGPMVLMSDWWIRAHWGRAFEIHASAPVHGQTWVLMRKRDIEITAAELAEPADDAREFLALRHNLRQVEQDRQRTLAEFRNESERARNKITSEYEQSLSWRITRPLREAAGQIRTLRARSQR